MINGNKDNTFACILSMEKNIVHRSQISKDPNTGQMLEGFNACRTFIQISICIPSENKYSQKCYLYCDKSILSDESQTLNTSTVNFA